MLYKLQRRLKGPANVKRVVAMGIKRKKDIQKMFLREGNE